MGQLVVINAPACFTWIWSIVKRWLSKETVEKADILGSDYQDVLLELLDADSLPSVFGGTCFCGEEGLVRTGKQCLVSGVGPWLDGREGWGPNARGKNEKREKEEDACVDVVVRDVNT